MSPPTPKQRPPRTFRAAALLLSLAAVTATELTLHAVAPIAGTRSELYPLHGARGARHLSERMDLGAFLDAAWTLIERDRDRGWRVRASLNLEASSLSLNETPTVWRVRTNARGWRHPDDDAPAGGVVALGDSSVFGWGVNDDEAWPRLLGRPAVNLGVPGYSSAQGLRQAREALPGLDPVVLALSYGANDGHFTPSTDEALLSARDTAVGGLAWRLSGLQLVSRIRDGLYPYRMRQLEQQYAEQGLTLRVAPDRYADNLKAIAALAPRARVVLVDICARHEYRHIMSTLAVSEGWPLVEYRGDTLDGCHPTPEGHEQLARSIEAAAR